MKRQVFLGGACGNTTWRKKIAIPALERAGITYYDPQLGLGEWTEECEQAEMQAKAEADALLFVISGETRGVASVAEVSYLIATHQPLVLVLEFLQQGTYLDSRCLTMTECDDLNRGRIFIRTMAQQHNVPVFDTVDEAVQKIIELIINQLQRLSLEQIDTLLKDIQFKDFGFIIEQTNQGFHLQLSAREPDSSTGLSSVIYGRKWFVSEYASKDDIVRTAFKAILTWQEHEAREFFKYQNSSIFSPHLNIDDLIVLSDRINHGD